MKKAGLNPALIYKSAGGGGITGQYGGSNVAGGQASDESSRVMARNAQMGLQLQQIRTSAEIANINADTNIKKVEAEKLSGVDTKLAEANISKIAAETNNEQIKSIGLKIDNEIKEIQAYIADQSAEGQIDLILSKIREINAEAKKIELNNEITEQQKDELIKKIANENMLILNQIVKNNSEIMVNNADAIMKSQQTKKLIAETGITEEQLRQYITYGVAPNNWITGVGSIVAKTTDMLTNWIDGIIHWIK